MSAPESESSSPASPSSDVQPRSRVLIGAEYQEFSWKTPAAFRTPHPHQHLYHREVMNFGRQENNNYTLIRPIPNQCIMCGRTDVNIPSQNKNICKFCDSSFWLHLNHQAVFKFCKGCKNFFFLEEFTDKPRGTKCEKCRERGKELYHLKKAASYSTPHDVSPTTAIKTLSSDSADASSHCNSSYSLSDSSKRKDPNSSVVTDGEPHALAVEAASNQPCTPLDVNHAKPPRRKTLSSSLPPSAAWLHAVMVTPAAPLRAITPSASNASLVLAGPISSSVDFAAAQVAVTPAHSAALPAPTAPPLRKTAGGDGSTDIGSSPDLRRSGRKRARHIYNDIYEMSLSQAVSPEAAESAATPASQLSTPAKGMAGEGKKWHWDPEADPLMQLAMLTSASHASPLRGGESGGKRSLI